MLIRSNKDGEENLLNKKLALQKQNRFIYEKKALSRKKNCFSDHFFHTLLPSKSNTAFLKNQGQAFEDNNLTTQPNIDIFADAAQQLEKEIKMYMFAIEQFQSTQKPFNDYIYQLIKSKIVENFSKEIDVG